MKDQSNLSEKDAKIQEIEKEVNDEKEKNQKLAQEVLSGKGYQCSSNESSF